MGLQLRPPAQPPPSSMACLQVETPAICRGKFKSVLQLRLQQRRSREQLVQQGIMPPLKTPAAFHEQIRNLERARTGNFLKHKICSRPQRAELVRMHILQETQAEPSLQATQMRLKRVRLADDLNEKIAQRPGPMELVEKNILPVAMEVQDTIPDSQDSDTKMADVYNFDEDSSDSLSAPQPDPRSQTSSSPSPREAGVKEPDSSAPYSPQINPSVSTSPPDPQTASDSPNLVSTTELQENNELRTSPKPSSTAAAVRGPVLVKQSQPKAASDKSRSKKSKEPKPRVRKLKYHQYVPPDHKPELSQVPMDSAYARLLQQQQQFLQLQILSHQQQHFSYQAIQPAPLKPGKDGQSSCSNVALSGNNLSAPRALYVAGALRLHPTLANHTLDCLPTNLDEMKVAELKAELKLRGLLVSGTKNDLIERLKLYRESSNVHLASHAARTPQTELRGGNFTPPVSPIAFKVSGMGLDEKLPGAVSPSHTSPSGSPLQADPPEASPAGSWASEKDMRLREKERQIEELMRKLEQEQRLVEELKMQLEVEKRGQQEETAAHAGPPALARVKQEAGTSSNCSASRGSPGPTVEVGQRRPPDQSRLTPPRPFFMSRQQPPRALERTRAQPQTQVLLPVRPPGSAVAIKPRGGGAELQSAATAPSFIQAPQKTEASPAASQQQSSSPTQTMTQADALSGLSAGSGCQFREQQSPGNKDKPQHLLNAIPQSGCHASTSCGQVVQGPTHKPTMILQHLKFTSPVSKCKDPPRYEDAVKQTRCMQTAVQGPSATSQHMDDLFDVLIESGEIPPFIRQEPSSMDKLTPVTAQVTTLPINTVLSRPPPLIQVALPPDPSQDPSGSLMALVSDHNMETLLEGTLHKQLLEQSQSSLDAMQLDYSDPTPPAAFHLRNANLDTMDWLELSMPVSEGAGTPLEMSSPTGVFPSDFLDSHDMHLSWD